MIRVLFILLIIFGLPVFSANLNQSAWTAHARPVDELNDGGNSGARLWKKKPDWIDLQSNYWKILQNVNSSGNRVTNWMQPENDFRITDVAECIIRHWQFIPIRANVEVINQNLIENLKDDRELALLIFLPHPSTFDLIKYNLISEYSGLETTPRGWTKVAEPEVISIEGYPAKLFQWKRGSGLSLTKKCRAVVDLPRYIRVTTDQFPCTSTKVVKRLVEKLRFARVLEQLGISEEERSKDTSPLVIKTTPIIPTPSIRLK